MLHLMRDPAGAGVELNVEPEAAPESARNSDRMGAATPGATACACTGACTVPEDVAVCCWAGVGFCGAAGAGEGWAAEAAAFFLSSGALWPAESDALAGGDA